MLKLFYYMIKVNKAEILHHIILNSDSTFKEMAEKESKGPLSSPASGSME